MAARSILHKSPVPVIYDGMRGVDWLRVPPARDLENRSDLCTSEWHTFAADPAAVSAVGWLRVPLAGT